MPGWYIHLEVARALSTLTERHGAAPLFGDNGPTALQIHDIATNNPAYVALGAIGPDIFFLLPDFKPPMGSKLWGAARTLDAIYSWWDSNFLQPLNKELKPLELDKTGLLSQLSGGLTKQLSDLSILAHNFLQDALMVLATRQYDIFGLMSSGVPEGYDEQAFFWSDMLHYRKTYEFAAHLWNKAQKANNDRFRAFALGWMTHLATDVAGHCFVNQKSGGPYRLHWQRHHLVENHMDAQVYDSKHGANQIYQMLSCSALHLWIAFKPDGASLVNFFDPQPVKPYATDDSSDSVDKRRQLWDPPEPELPQQANNDLAAFIADALQDVYAGASAGADGQSADRPDIISSIQPDPHQVWPNKNDIAETYRWLYRYMKMTATDFFELRRPDEPQFIEAPDKPAVPGLPEIDTGLQQNDNDVWADFLEFILAIFAWMLFLAALPLLAGAILVGLIASGATFLLRDFIYWTIEIPLYNAWMSLHWYLAMSGFVYPMQNEMNAGLNTLGVGVGDVWGTLWKALDDPWGGIGSHPLPNTSEHSGLPRLGANDQAQQPYPIDVIVDPTTLPAGIINLGPGNTCGDSEGPSEFLRPWLWPLNDNDGDPVPTETPVTPPGPFHRGQDATILMGAAPGNAAARDHFEKAQCEADTIHVAQQHLPANEHLGDPVDYSYYVIAQLTRDKPPSNPIANFNLDADRGYGYLCWDWLRTKEFMATPGAWTDTQNNTGLHTLQPGGPNKDQSRRGYPAPLRPGAGWCDMDLAEDNQPTPDFLPPHGSQRRPTKHDPARDSEPPVRIRYINREEKFWKQPVSAPGIVAFTDAGVQRLSVLAHQMVPNKKNDPKIDEDHLCIYHGRQTQWQSLDEYSLSNTTVIGTPAAVVVQTGPNHLIYGFMRGRYDHLQVHFWDGTQWLWRDQSTPDGTVVDSSPGAITYSELGVQRIYAFVCGLDGHLHINFFDGARWQWTDQGVPDGTTVFDTPAALTFQDAGLPGVQIIYSFVRGRNGNLFVHYWNGAQWQWENVGAPANVRIAGAPAAIFDPQHVRAFVRGSDGHLYMAELRITRLGKVITRQWVWSDQGTPQNTAVSTNPAAITYLDGNLQRVFVFVRGEDSQLYVNFWNGAWQWAAQGKPDATTVDDAPGAITFLDSGIQWIYAVVRGEDNLYHANIWNGSQWSWTTLPAPRRNE